ncbi:MAG: hypothetical protein DI536_28980 [Archangium gephyra]|uniref:ASCH domain-containing protein n=1 Tax=Archangium gephyra TaxID=48 RepID=A0A2W5T2K1_9BACT|nr:MAG: hypothetical protein DI536_28980 [Archangium gephyra]
MNEQKTQVTHAATWDKKKPLLALTLWQPWAFGVAHGWKLVENRDWVPSWKQLQPGDDLVIHAAVKQGGVQSDWLDMRTRARAAGVIDKVPTFEVAHVNRWIAYGAIVAVARFDGIAHKVTDLAPEQRPWWVGRFGWKLSNVRQLHTAIPCRGHQQLWALGGVELERLERELGTDEGFGLWRRTAV